MAGDKEEEGSQRVCLHSKGSISKFNVNFRNWMEFYNVFCLLVRENQELYPASKFQYLKSDMIAPFALFSLWKSPLRTMKLHSIY